MDSTPGFVRYQAAEADARGIRAGIFALANGLARSGTLSGADRRWWRAANDWYDAAYPDPNLTDPTIYDRTLNPGAQAWFKTTAVHLLVRIPGYLDLLDRYGVPWEEVRSISPGRILYDDDVQVIADPHR